jgi:hypothetical protein
MSLETRADEKIAGQKKDYNSIIEAAIARLAKDVGAVFEPSVIEALRAVRNTSPADYQRYRKRIKDAGAGVGELDRLVCANGGGEMDNDANGAKGRGIELYEPEPWESPVDGAKVLNDARQAIRRHMMIRDEHVVAAALWAAHAHVYDVFSHTPRLGITAPDAECGKSLLLYHLVGALVTRPQPVELMKAAPFFRLAEQFKPTFLIDEVDVFIKEDSDLLAAINNGWEPHGGVTRCVGENFEVRIFSTHCPVAMGGVKLHKVLPATTLSRTVVITLERAAEGEIAEPYDPRKHRAGLLEIGQRLARWCADNRNILSEAAPILPNHTFGRRVDKWRPLFAIAEAAGGEWPALARQALLFEEKEGAMKLSTALQLLSDVRETLKPDEQVIATADLIGRLCALDESPWAEYNFKAREEEQRRIQPRQVSTLLRDYAVKPEVVRIGLSTPRGYKRSDLERAWRRYIPPTVCATAQQHRQDASSSGSSSATQDENVADRGSPEPTPGKDCCVVTDRDGGIKKGKGNIVLPETSQRILRAIDSSDRPRSGEWVATELGMTITDIEPYLDQLAAKGIIAPRGAFWGTSIIKRVEV